MSIHKSNQQPNIRWFTELAQLLRLCCGILTNAAHLCILQPVRAPSGCGEEVHCLARHGAQFTFPRYRSKLPTPVDYYSPQLDIII